jgi:hypothetical protein
VKAKELLTRAEALGISVHVEGQDLVLRRDGGLPAGLLKEMRRHKPEVVAFLGTIASGGDVTCRGCAASIPVGTTLCAACGRATSPLVRFAVELGDLTRERSLRGQALCALDQRRYPRLDLSDGRKVGPGLLAWCPVLREAGSSQLREIVGLAQASGEGGPTDE